MYAPLPNKASGAVHLIGRRPWNQKTDGHSLNKKCKEAQKDNCKEKKSIFQTYETRLNVSLVIMKQWKRNNFYLVCSNIYVLFLDISGHSKVGNLTYFFFANQDISRSQVTMDNLTISKTIIKKSKTHFENPELDKLSYAIVN